MSNKNKPKVDPQERLVTTVFGGEDFGKAPRPSQAVFATCLRKIKEEREKEAEERAMDQFRTLIDLRREMLKVEKDFKSAQAKINKRLGGLLGPVEAMMSGGSVPEGAEATEDNVEDDNSGGTGDE